MRHPREQEMPSNLLDPAAWPGFASYPPDSKPHGSAVVAENVHLAIPGALEPRKGWDPMSHSILTSAWPMEALYPWDKFGGDRSLVAVSDRNFYVIDNPTIRTGAGTTVVSPSNPSEGADTLKTWHDSTPSFNSEVTIPGDATQYGFTFLYHDGWGVGQANSGDGFRRHGIYPPPNAFTYAAWLDWHKNSGIPEDYSCGVTLNLQSSQPTTSAVIAVHKVYALYYDSDTKRWSDPCRPAIYGSFWEDLYGGGSPITSGQYSAIGSDDPSVDEVVWFRTLPNSDEAYEVGREPNAIGTVTMSTPDTIPTKDLAGYPKMPRNNRHPRAGRYITVCSGRVVVAGEVSVDLTGVTISVTQDSRKFTLSSAVNHPGLVGALIRADGGEEIYVVEDYESTTVGYFRTPYKEATNASAALVLEGQSSSVIWSEAGKPEAFPLRNEHTIRGDGEITGLASYEGNLLVFFQQAVHICIPGDGFSANRGARWRRLGDEGCIAHRTIIQRTVGERSLLFWLSQDAFCVYGGGDSIQRLTDAKLLDYLQNMHAESAPKSWAVHDSDNRCIRIFTRQNPFPAWGGGATNAWPDHDIAWFYDRDAWVVNRSGRPEPEVAQIKGWFTHGCRYYDPTLNSFLVLGASFPDDTHIQALGRGMGDGFLDSAAAGMSGTISALPGGATYTLDGTLPTAPDLAGSAYIEFGREGGGTIPVGVKYSFTQSGQDVTITAVGGAVGDTYRIGHVEPIYKWIVPWAQLKQSRALQSVHLLVETASSGTELELRIYRNGQQSPGATEWASGDGGRDQGTIVTVDGTTFYIAVDMAHVRQSGDTRAVIQVDCAISDINPQEVIHLELRSVKAGQTWRVVAASVNQAPAPHPGARR